MKDTVFIVGPLHEARPLLVSSLEPYAFVCVFGTAAEMARELGEHLLPDLLILSVMGAPEDDLPLFTLVEQYWEGGTVSQILISPFPLEQAKDALFYTPYATVCFVQPINVEAVVQKALQLLCQKKHI